MEAGEFSGAMIGFPAAGTPNILAGRARRSGTVVLGRLAVAVSRMWRRGAGCASPGQVIMVLAESGVPALGAPLLARVAQAAVAAG